MVFMLVGAIAAAMVLCSAAPVQASFLNSCTYCHGMPPKDGVRKGNPHYDSVSSSFSGNHQTHAAGAADCSLCHTPVAPTAFGHQDEHIDFQANINTSPAIGQYKVGGVAVVFKNQTSIPVLGSCSSVNCHFESQTPVWGSAKLVSPAGCATCHGTPPSGGATGTAGSHAKHDTYYTGTANCVKCHSDHTAEAKPFAHATSVGRVLNIQIEGGGTYSGTKTNYLPSQSASQSFGTCNSVYCHSSVQGPAGTGSITYQNPAWGSATPLNCGSCHVNMSSSASATGSHIKHAQTAQITCDKCHSGYTASTVTTATHVDKSINLDYTGTTGATISSTITPGTAYSSCTTSYCHSTVQGATGAGNGTGQSVTWGGSALNCGSCHVDMSTSGSATGSHIKHAQASGYSIACSVCHGTGYSSATVVYPGHADGSINLGMTGIIAPGTTYNKGTSFAPKAVYGTCSNSKCHSNGQATPTYASPYWGGAAVTCTSCHDTKRSSMTASTLSGKHDRHLNYSTNSALGLGNSFNCIDCHAKTVSGNTTISDKTKHVNGMVDYSGARAGKTYSAGTCSTVYCHSNGNARGATSLVYINMTGSKTWTGSASFTCNGCHGRSHIIGSPDYASGAPGSATANSHPIHVTAAGITDTTGCTNCHAKTADAVIPNKFKNYTANSYHINGNRDIYFRASAGGAAASFNGSTCSSTYCHGALSPQWGTLGSLTCASCHSANNLLPGAHQIHVTTTPIASSYTNMSGNVSTTSNYRFSCAACHKGQHANGPPASANGNGVAEVFYGFTSSTMKGSYAYGALGGTDSSTFKWSTGGAGCNTTYCHSNGTNVSGSNGASAVAWSTIASTGTCVQCHGDATSLTTGAHAKHVSVGGKNLGCVECHAKTVSGNTAISDKRKHVNKFKDYSGLRAGGSASYNLSTKSCNNAYCHSDGKGTKVAVTWTGAAACGSCHAATSPVIATNAHFTHFSTAFGPKYSRVENSCAACHTYTNDLAATHVNGMVDVNTTGTSTCTNQCHRNASPLSGWATGTRLACETCHDGNVSYDARFTNISAPRKSMTIFTQTAAHGNYGTPSKYVCTTCHSNTSSHIDGVRGSTNRLGATYESNQNGLCSSCHSNAATVTNALRRITLSHVTTLGGTATALCSSCHNVHGTANYASIVSSITVGGVSVAISHPATGTNFINTTTNRGLCQVCHTLTNHFRRDLAESGANSGYNSAGTDHSAFTATTNCLSCHTHDGVSVAFAPNVSAMACDSCHGYPPVPRNTNVTINTSGNYLNAKFQNYTGGGGAHVVNNHVPKTAIASDAWSANCTKCHKESDHVPSPTNFKPSSNIKVNIDQRYRFVSTTQAKYSSNRLDGNLHVTNKCSNISCHFGATPAWNQR